jgi:heme/copper-type cytochrome/quinol oxidase subunit 2
MKTYGKKAAFMMVAMLALGSGSMEALGCATCFGQSDSPLAHGMNMAIMTLLGVVLTVMALIVAFFIHVSRRSAKAGLSMEERGVAEPVEKS